MKDSINIIESNKMFYNVYEIDAYIFNMLFDYKILDNRKVGFPKSILNKIINTLENKHISYNIIFKNKDNIIKDFKNRNTYNKYKDMAYEKIDIDRLMYIVYEVFK